MQWEPTQSNNHYNELALHLFSESRARSEPGVETGARPVRDGAPDMGQRDMLLTSPLNIVRDERYLETTQSCLKC
jgi:hypothetical protein